jgi:aspartate-semialdehyde dehydrogenase
VARSTLVIIGAESLLGRDLRDVITERDRDAQLELISASEQILTQEEDEPLVIAPLIRERLLDADVIFLAASAASSYKTLEIAPDDAALIDVTGALEDHPDASIAGRPGAARNIRLVPHPAAIVIARIIATVREHAAVRHSVVHAFEPASERGQAGINELQQQTASLLAFRPLDKAVFDAQLSFNMLPRYGGAAPQPLEETEQRIERHLATLLGPASRMPSLRLIQAPVFHGHSFSFWFSFENTVDTARLIDALETTGVDVRTPDVEPPTNVGLAGQSGVTVGLIEPDRNYPRSLWMWAASDNLRVAADAAVDLLAEVTE